MAKDETPKTPKIEAFDPKSVQRERALAWNEKANGGKGGAITTSDLMNDDSSVNETKCKEWSVSPARVTFITVADLGEPYTHGASRIQDIVKHAAADAGYSPNDYVLSLVLKDAMQTAYNASVRAIRPVTDRAKERASNTLRTVLRAQGKTEAEINAVLAALG